MIHPERKYIALGKNTNINMKRSDYYTIQELREIMHLSTAGVYKEVHKEGFPKILIGKRIYISIKKFTAYWNNAK